MYSILSWTEFLENRAVLAKVSFKLYKVDLLTTFELLERGYSETFLPLAALK